jgi:hypothetical protein
VSNYDSGFDRAQRAYDNATPEDLYVFDDEHDGYEPDPDDARDRAYDAAQASDWDDVPAGGLTAGDWGGPSPLDD